MAASQNTEKPRKKQIPERSVWHDIKVRCYDPKNKSFHNYGGRGIRVCQRWRESFEAFFSDMGPRPSSKHSIDRIDPNGDYEPGNCRWATWKEQQRNRRWHKLVTFRGETKCLFAWAEECGIPPKLLWARLENLKWSVERALTTPSRSYVETYTIDGVTKSMRQWAYHFGLSPQLVHQRRKRDGWTLEQALFTPKNGGPRKP